MNSWNATPTPSDPYNFKWNIEDSNDYLMGYHYGQPFGYVYDFILSRKALKIPVNSPDAGDSSNPAAETSFISAPAPDANDVSDFIYYDTEIMDQFLAQFNDGGMDSSIDPQQ